MLTDDQCLELNELLSALADNGGSALRLKIVNYLSQRPRNRKDIINDLGISSYSVLCQHVDKLSRVGLIIVPKGKGKGGEILINKEKLDLLQALLADLLNKDLQP